MLNFRLTWPWCQRKYENGEWFCLYWLVFCDYLYVSVVCEGNLSQEVALFMSRLVTRERYQDKGRWQHLHITPELLWYWQFIHLQHVRWLERDWYCQSRLEIWPNLSCQTVNEGWLTRNSIWPIIALFSARFKAASSWDKSCLYLTLRQILLTNKVDTCNFFSRMRFILVMLMILRKTVTVMVIYLIIGIGIEWMRIVSR